MKRVAFVPLLIMVFCIVQSCKKEVSLQNYNVNLPINDISYSEKKFSVSNHVAFTLKTPTGLKIHFPAFALVNKFGESVTDNITIEVKEILKPDAMILHNMPTISGNQLLESGGEFFIGVSKGSEKLRLAPGVFIKMDLPKIGVNMNGMQVFNGKTDSITGNFDWQQNSSSGNLIVRNFDSLQATTNFDSYSLFSDELEWINCDRYINETRFDLTVYPGNAPNIDSTDGFIHFSGRNSVIYIENNVSSFYGKVIGVPATLIGICRSNGELKASIQKLTLTPGLSPTMNFVKMTEAELKQKLKALR